MMTADDNSIYVGGLPYDCTDPQLRRVFELYGSILSVKIKSDRGVGGKCYGFVTFTNPRSAVEAISEMDGKTIGGRVVRVNGVKSRGGGGRFMQGRENFRHNQRNTDWDEGRGRGRNKVYNRDRQRDNSRELDEERERRYDCSRDRDHPRDHFEGRDRDQSRDSKDWEQVNNRNHDREPDKDYVIDATQDTELDRVVDHDRGGDKNKDCHTKRKRSSSYEGESREHSSESSDYYHQEERLDLLIKKRDELQKEKFDMEQRLEEKNQLIIDLQKRSLKLEDSLTSAKKLSSMRQLQLTKLCKCFQQVKEYGEKLKSSEQELQDVVDSVSMEFYPDVVGVRETHLRNGEV